MSGWLRICTAALLLALGASHADAARVGVLSNRFFDQAAADFDLRVPGHTFTGVDVGSAAPSLSSLIAAYDVLLVFADRNFATAPAVGDVAAAFANSGRAVLLGTFYDQQRSDAGGAGWGALEALDPNTTDGLAVPSPNGQSRTLDTASIVPHPLSRQVSALFGTQWAGGNEAKPGSRVIARWQQPNSRGNADPAIAYRVTGRACVIQIGIAPHYAARGTLGVEFGGDFYRVWQNAFDYAAAGCTANYSSYAVPTLSEWALALLALAVALLALFEHRRAARR